MSVLTLEQGAQHAYLSVLISRIKLLEGEQYHDE